MKIKKTAGMALVTIGVLVFTGVAFAQMYGWGGGPCYGYGGYGMMGYYESNVGGGNLTNIENLKKFQKDTLSLRDEVITKHAELAKEYNNSAPDFARVSELRQQIIDLQTKINKTAEKYGLTTGGWRPGRGYGGYGYHMGPGMMYGPYGY